MSGAELVAVLAGTLASLVWIYAFVTGGFGREDPAEQRDESEESDA